MVATATGADPAAAEMGCTVMVGGLLPALEAADRFFSSVMMKAHSFMNPKASPYNHRVITISITSYACY